MSGDYLISRPGRPLHLTLFAYDGAEHQADLRWRSVHCVPLCGQDRGRQWRITGEWAEKWEQHRAPLCSRCAELLAQMVKAAALLDVSSSSGHSDGTR